MRSTTDKRQRSQNSAFSSFSLKFNRNALKTSIYDFRIKIQQNNLFEIFKIQ